MRTKLTNSSIWYLIEPLLKSNSHTSVRRDELADILQYVDDLDPFTYAGQTFVLNHKHLGVGVYRIWFEKKK